MFHPSVLLDALVHAQTSAAAAGAHLVKLDLDHDALDAAGDVGLAPDWQSSAIAQISPSGRIANIVLTHHSGEAPDSVMRIECAISEPVRSVRSISHPGLLVTDRAGVATAGTMLVWSSSAVTPMSTSSTRPPSTARPASGQPRLLLSAVEAGEAAQLPARGVLLLTYSWAGTDRTLAVSEARRCFAGMHRLRFAAQF